MRFLFLLMLIFPSSRGNASWNLLFNWPKIINKCETRCLEIFDEKDLQPQQMWSKTSSCQQGCRFYSLTQVMDFFGSTDKEISKSCHDSCHEANILLNFRRACDRGCQEMKRLIPETESVEKEPDFIDVFDLGTRMQTFSALFGFKDSVERKLAFDEVRRTADVVPNEFERSIFGDADIVAPRQIAHVWIQTMPISGRLTELGQVPSEIDGDFQIEEEAKAEMVPWTLRSCLSGRSGLPDWALLFLLAVAFVYLSYLGGQFFSNVGNRCQQVPNVVYLPPYKSVRRLSDSDSFFKFKPDDIETDFVKKPPISSI